MDGLISSTAKSGHPTHLTLQDRISHHLPPIDSACQFHLSVVGCYYFPLISHICLLLLGLVRFIPKSGKDILIGEPTDKNVDVGAATLAGKDVEVEVFSGSSVLSPGTSTGKKELIGRVLSPLVESEVGTIRCIGLNVSRISVCLQCKLLADTSSMFNMHGKRR